ncbi:hypothetical protein [Altererythrobacter aquiaggeris]|uniref:hypothetical protein n=1 Tax=Aestuarierythrobacter aquiaggeris TaxID=1898396 RepID=UPI003019EDA9
MTAVLLGTHTAVVAQEMPRIVADEAVANQHPLPDFSYAGYGFGTEPIPHVDHVLEVADYGAIPDDGKDDSAALIAALAAAHELDGPVRVQLRQGRYILTEILWIEKSGIVLSGIGSGDNGTQIFMPRPLNQIDDDGALTEIREYLKENDKYERQPDANLDVLFSEYSWSAGFIWVRYPGGRHATYKESYDRPIETVSQITAGSQFEQRLIVSQPDKLKVGDVMQINWHNRQGPGGALIKSLYGETDLQVGSRHWEKPDRPLVRQATRIEAIDGNTVTIADPLLHDINAELPAYLARWDHLTDVGIQDLALTFPENPYFGHHNEAGFNGVYFTGVHNGWIRNVRISESDAGILTDDAANVTIANVVTDGKHKAHYAVHVGNVHNLLVDGLTVFNPTEHTFSFNTQATKSVYKDSVAWHQPTLDQHAGANHQNLYDGLTVHVVADQSSADGKPMYDLFKAGGAGYWNPGHGRYNTTWNLKVIAEGNVAPDSPLVLLAGSEGPDARVVGLHGNRKIQLDFRPEPYAEMLGKELTNIPSLYNYQLGKRIKQGR